jgi:hypothetical protein
MADLDKRDQFLIAMYNQLMNDINRHIVVVWQSIATLIAAIATFSLVKDNVLSNSVAASIVLIACVWLLAHVYDASYWYNRNLVMVANIERQFLYKSDLRDIHYYFGAHRPENRMISHLSIQKGLGIAIALLVLITHAIKEVIPVLWGLRCAEFQMVLPWVVAGVGGVIWFQQWKHGREKYQEFLKNSPGAQIDVSDVQYGKGHGFLGS